MGKSNIEWTDMVWNPITGCTKVSEGCANCYAERMAMRFTGHFNVTCHPDRLDQPLHWKKPRRIFVCSMGDLFHEDVPFEFISKVGRAITDSEYRFEDDYGYPEKHQFMILTKRPKRMGKYFEYLSSGGGPLTACPIGDNIWLGVTVESPDYLWRIDELLKISDSVHFISFEPLLGDIDLEAKYDFQSIGWCIIGAESGQNRRECKIEWVRHLAKQCELVDIPVFIKQLDINGKLSKNMDEWPEDLRVRDYPS